MKLILITVVLLIMEAAEGQKFNRGYVGVAYSPYTDHLPARNWDQYSEADIRAQLSVVRNYFSSIATYSMGTASYNRGKAWYQCDSNALIARAAADLNKQSSTKLNVNIGIYQGEDRERAISNAFEAAKDANRRSPGTVWGITFTNEYIKSPEQGQEVLNMIKSNKNNANRQGLRVGTRTEACGAILGGNLKNIFVDIVKNSDYIYCNVYASKEHAALGPERAATEVMNYFLHLQNKIKEVNPGIEVIIGETGWPSQENSFNDSHNTVQKQAAYWKALNELAGRHRVKTLMFEAFDEPWKGKSSQWKAESYYGWWSKPGNSENKFIEKETGKRF